MRIALSNLIALALLCFCLSSQAQLKIPFTNNDLRSNLSRVLSDYPQGFSALKGDTIAVNPQSIEFATRLNFQGSEENSITQYESKNGIYSWQAVLLTTENFEDATKKYKWLFNQLKAMTVKVQDYSFTLDGNYDAPNEGKKFFSSIFKLTPNAANMPRLKVEASMQFEFPEWKIHLIVYEKEREDNEQGDINSN